MAVRPTQPLQEMSTKGYLLDSKGVWCVGLTALPTSCAESVEILGAQGPAALRASPEYTIGSLVAFIVKLHCIKGCRTLIEECNLHIND